MHRRPTTTAAAVVRQTDAVICRTYTDTSTCRKGRPDGTISTVLLTENGIKDDDEHYYLDFTSADFVHVTKFENGRCIAATRQVLPTSSASSYKSCTESSLAVDDSICFGSGPQRNLYDIRENFEMPSSSNVIPKDGVYRAVPAVVTNDLLEEGGTVSVEDDFKSLLSLLPLATA